MIKDNGVYPMPIKGRAEIQGYDPNPAFPVRVLEEPNFYNANNTAHLSSHRLVLKLHGRHGLQITIGDKSIAIPDLNNFMWLLGQLHEQQRGVSYG